MILDRKGDRMSKKERLDKILANMGYGSRKDVKKFIKDGRVKVIILLF